MHNGHLDRTVNVQITLRFCDDCGGWTATARSWHDAMWDAEGYAQLSKDTVHGGPLDDLSAVTSELSAHLCELVDKFWVAPRLSHRPAAPPVPPKY